MVTSAAVTSAILTPVAPAQSAVLREKVSENVIEPVAEAVQPVVKEVGNQAQFLVGLDPNRTNLEKIIAEEVKKQQRASTGECDWFKTPHANERGLTYYCGEAG